MLTQHVSEDLGLWGDGATGQRDRIAPGFGLGGFSEGQVGAKLCYVLRAFPSELAGRSKPTRDGN